MLANPIPRKKENRANKINLLEEIVSGTVHTRPEEFEKGGFTLKTHEMFSVHTTPEEFKNTTITGLLRYLCLTKLGQGNHVTIVTSSFSERVVFQIVSCPPKETQSQRF